ncbi:MAG: NADH-quinone oxidoreductase subunit J [Armatimonadota bacterium]|nr:NADH-quinone oxidoreductase subunit J [Armatimonadota bacterium]
MAELIIFVVLGAVAVGAGIAVVAARNPVHSALFLVVNFFCLAALFLVLSAEFVAVLQVLVYAGAIMVLFLFVIMLLNVGGVLESLRDPLGSQRWLALLLGLGLVAEVTAMVISGAVKLPAPSGGIPAGFGSPSEVGLHLYSRYLFPFEVVSLLLLVAMVGVVVLNKRRD